MRRRSCGGRRRRRRSSDRLACEGPAAASSSYPEPGSASAPFPWSLPMRHVAFADRSGVIRFRRRCPRGAPPIGQHRRFDSRTAPVSAAAGVAVAPALDSPKILARRVIKLRRLSLTEPRHAIRVVFQAAGPIHASTGFDRGDHHHGVSRGRKPHDRLRRVERALAQL